MIEALTPTALRDLYNMLPDESKQEFIRLLGEISSGETPFILVSALSPPERYRFSNLISREMLDSLLPVVFAEAHRLARDEPTLTDKEFSAKMMAKAEASVEEHDRMLGEVLAAQFKAQRDRKSDPETIKRNIEICDLYRRDRKHWTQGRLAKKHGITPRAVRKILSEEAKWRRLKARSGTN